MTVYYSGLDQKKVTRLSNWARLIARSQIKSVRFLIIPHKKQILVLAER